MDALEHAPDVQESAVLDKITVRRSSSHAKPAAIVSSPSPTKQDSNDNICSKHFHQVLDLALASLDGELVSDWVRAQSDCQKAEAEASSMREELQIASEDAIAAHRIAKQKLAHRDALAAQYFARRKAHKEAEAHLATKDQQVMMVAWKRAAKLNVQKVAESQRYGKVRLPATVSML